MKVVHGITQHTVIIVVEKQERGLVLESVMKRCGFKTLVAISLYDALKLVGQEMPHLVITESILIDGTAATLYDRLIKQPMLMNIPILVLVAKKTREQLLPLTGRKFAGFILGQFDGAALKQKVAQILGTASDLSPYFVHVDSTSIETSFTLSMEATALGLSGDQVIYKSKTEIDPMASLVCVPLDKSKGPVLLKMGSNVRKGEDVFNMFPMSRVRGVGRKWLAALPEIDLDNSSPVQKEEIMKRVVFFDPNQKRADQFKEVLAGYNFELLHTISMLNTIKLIQRDAGNIGCVFLQELAPGASSITLKETLAKMPANERPVLIIGTSSLNMRSTPEIRYIKKPFGLGVLVEMMDAACAATLDIADSMASGNLVTANIDVCFQAPALLVGFDEMGGIIQVKFPVVKGGNVRLIHPFVQKIWNDDDHARIVDVAILPDKLETWQARVEKVEGVGNKVKYWEKVKACLDATLKAEGKEPH